MPLPDLQPSTQQKELRSSCSRIAAERSQLKGDNRVEASKQCTLDGQEPSVRGERLKEDLQPQVELTTGFLSQQQEEKRNL